MLLINLCYGLTHRDKGRCSLVTFNDSNQMNSRKQVSNGYDDTSTGDEQIRPMVSFSSRRSWMEPPRGILDWCRRTEGRWGGQRTEDEDNTLGMTQKVSDIYNSAKSRERIDESNGVWTRLDQEVLWCWCLWSWGDEDEMRCRCAWLGLRWNQVRVSDDNDDWLGRRTDRSVTIC